MSEEKIALAFTTTMHPFAVIVENVFIPENEDNYFLLTELLGNDSNYTTMAFSQGNNMVIFCSNESAIDEIENILKELEFFHFQAI